MRLLLKPKEGSQSYRNAFAALTKKKEAKVIVMHLPKHYIITNQQEEMFDEDEWNHLIDEDWREDVKMWSSNLHQWTAKEITTTTTTTTRR